MVANTFLSFSRMPWSSHGCNDGRYSYFTRNICYRCVDSLKILFRASSEGSFAIVTTILRPGLKERNGSSIGFVVVKLPVKHNIRCMFVQLLVRSRGNRNDFYFADWLNG